MFHQWDAQRRYHSKGKRFLYMNNISSGGPKDALRMVSSFFMASGLNPVFRMLRSPGHMLFLASNVSIFVQLHHYSTMRRRENTERFVEKMRELENHLEVMKDLESQEVQVRKQIELLKLMNSESHDEFNETEHKNHISQAEATKERLHLKKEKNVIAAEMVHSTIRDIRRATSEEANLKEHSKLADQFLLQRKAFSATFTDPTNLLKLFANPGSKWSSLVGSEKLDLLEPSIGCPELTYYSPVQNSLLALSGQLMTSFLVELNLRQNLRGDNRNLARFKESFIFNESLFPMMKEVDDKAELLEALWKIRSKSAPPKNDFWESLDAQAIDELFQRFHQSESFKSIDLYRYNFHHYKSGRHLNYEHSDTLKSIQALQPTKFQSNIVSNDEYLHQFEKIFSEFEAESGDLKHMNLILRIAKTLANGGLSIPTFTIFRYLLDNLGRVGLYNQQSVVYDNLVAFEHRQTVLADSSSREATPKKWYHFASLIEKDPAFLTSLINYQISRKDTTTFQQVVSYFDNLCTSTAVEFFPRLMKSKSATYNTFNPETHILVELKSLEAAIEGCVNLKQYGLIDGLLNKLVLNLVQTSEGVKVALNKVEDESALISGNCDALDTGLLVFSEGILVLLLSAYSETNDKTRMKWLLPHVQTFLNHRKSDRLTMALRNVQMSAETFNSFISDMKALPGELHFSEQQRERSQHMPMELDNNIFLSKQLHKVPPTA